MQLIDSNLAVYIYVIIRFGSRGGGEEEIPRRLTVPCISCQKRIAYKRWFQVCLWSTIPNSPSFMSDL